MNNRAALYMQAIRGPVLLVTIGVLFAIHQAHVLSFSRTWPLLIIVIGVMKLLERTSAPPPEQWQNPAPGAYQQGQYGPQGTYPSYQGQPHYPGPVSSSQNPPQRPGGPNS